MDDDEKEQFYGCGFQRFLAIGLLSPFIALISFTGIVLMVVLLPETKMVHEIINNALAVRKIPYRILKDLAELLDIPGEFDWKCLIAELPPHRYRYTPQKISKLDMIYQRPGGSPSMTLLNDFGTQLMTVGELVTYLEAINHQEALLLVKPHEPVTITRQPRPVSVQAGENLLLQCEATAFPGPTYQWYKNDNTIGSASNELKLNSVREDASGNYYCKVTNPIGSEYTDVVQVQVTPVYMEPVEAYHHEAPQYCPANFPEYEGAREQTIYLFTGQSFALTCDRPALSYQWHRNSYPIRGAFDNHLYFNHFLPADEGYYSCLIDDGKQQIFTELAYLKCREMSGISVDDSANTNKEFATGKLALIIANQDYNNPRHPGKLNLPVNDAKLLQEKLEQIGFKVFSFSNLSRQEMKAAIKGFCSILTCSPDLYSLFYFCGHGFEEQGKTYLVPIDDDVDWSCRSAIAAQEVLSDIQQQGSTKLDVVLLDVCRTREPSGSDRCDSVNPPFKAGSQCVFGYATCPQSQCYEVRQHNNGIYMKHLANHITENIQVEAMLHKVGIAAREEAERLSKTSKMSPTFNSTTTKVFSLCDPVFPAGFVTGERDPEVEWFQYHRLPSPRTIMFEHGIKVQMKFLREPCQMSNTCNIIVFLEDKGDTIYCDAKFSEEGAVLSRCVQQYDSLDTTTTATRSSNFERWTEVPALQKIQRSLEITVYVEYKLHDEKSSLQKSTKFLSFEPHEFGITSLMNQFAPAPMTASFNRQMVYIDSPSPQHSSDMKYIDESLNACHF